MSLAKNCWAIGMFPIISPAIYNQEETTNALVIYLQPSEILTYLTNIFARFIT